MRNYLEELSKLAGDNFPEIAELFIQWANHVRYETLEEVVDVARGKTPVHTSFVLDDEIVSQISRSSLDKGEK